MAGFLRTAALLAGIANAALFWLAASSRALLGDDAGDRYWPHGLMFVALSAVAGLLAAEALLKARRPIHEKAFFARYALVVFGVFIGGTLSGLALAISNAAFYVDPASGNTATSMILFAPLIMVLGGSWGLWKGCLSLSPWRRSSGCSERRSRALSTLPRALATPRPRPRPRPRPGLLRR